MPLLTDLEESPHGTDGPKRGNYPSFNKAFTRWSRQVKPPIVDREKSRCSSPGWC